VVTDPPAAAYFAAFEKVDADPRNLLVVAEDEAGTVVGTLQMTLIPGLSNQGAELALIEAVRVASTLRGRGVGAELVGWAMDAARARGCQAVELFTHLSRVEAQRFYEQLGFERSHAGMRRAL
jgi:predicted N-acetyltransferase YhbS